MDASAIFHLFVDLAPAELFRSLQQQLQLKKRSGIYSPRVVLWMMINQRLQARGTLASSVEQLVQGRFDPLLSQCKRVRDKRIALSTGGYCQARQDLPKLLVSRTMDELIQRLRSRLLEPGVESAQRVYLLDGSSLQLEHEPDLLQAFPLARRERRPPHWPLLRFVVLHDLETALAERPEWGPMNGPEAVGEQELAERAMQSVAAGSMLVGDRNFGIFSTAHSAQQHGLEVVLRLTEVRAKFLLGQPISGQGDYPVCWRPSRWDGQGKRVWPTDASVPGRLIAWCVGSGQHQQWLHLFTTSSLPAEQVVALYGLRWRIETDLRSLKQTIRLQRIEAHSTDMMEKELLVAVMAYNLVRAFMLLAAQRAKLDPRELSFTYACNIVLDGYPKILAASTARQQQRELERILDLVARCKLPKRTKRRSYPREVWGSGSRFPSRQAGKTK